MAYENAAYSAGTPVTDPQIIAGGTYTTRVVTLLSGEVRSAGAVLGKITSGGKYKLSASAAGDGSEDVALVLAHDADASGGDIEVLCYETCSGGVVGSALTLGTGHTIASIRDAMRAIGLPIDD
ncbi:head decoration protein [Croceicoccus gelatinilyticus]|uniref:head decoration protein n=1 Tax=Croceicoccus gelatinilyticus TaxID=2835536 RepID=UPI001BCD48A2|nr:head decoration protein [Croceicoccus gelatinilyticus]MBS7669342.1 head decoration protein [Croceicoccus gelatinilyticus]